jgi:hypothetical protein
MMDVDPVSTAEYSVSDGMRSVVVGWSDTNHPGPIRTFSCDAAKDRPNGLCHQPLNDRTTPCASSGSRTNLRSPLPLKETDHAHQIPLS